MKVIYEPKPGRANGPEPFPFDYEAYSDEWDEGDPVGFGATAEAAIADLLAKSNDITHETFMERHSSRRSSMQDNKKAEHADRKAEHEAEHADRKAEHADRKAEREQERAARKAQREADGLPPEPDEEEDPTQLPA